MKGKIIKGIAGFYYVNIPGKGIYECKARGVFRNKKITPLIGDNVEIEILENEEKKGNILEILERKNELIRPSVANIDQVVIVFSVKNPAPNINLLDRFIVMIEKENIPITICFNKIDVIEENDIMDLKSIYSNIGYPIYITSVVEDKGIDSLKESLYNKTTVFAGPSGVGKSSILNIIQKEIHLETGEVSHKTKRGKHTTRHAELICFYENSYVVDTPGFSTMELTNLLSEDLKHLFIEFNQYSKYCKFNGCNHLNEPGCEVKNKVEKGEINNNRYNNYKNIFNELDTKRRW